MFNSFTLFALFLAFVLFILMVAMLVIGRRIGKRRLEREPAAHSAGLGVIDAAVFGLMGLLIAFTFSGAGSRFDERRQLIVQEANDIGTAFLRIDMLPAEAQAPMRQMFRDYTDARIATTRPGNDIAAATTAMDRAVALQGQIWSSAVAAVKTPGMSPAAATLMLPALNAMIDITTTRKMAAQRHPPVAIWVLFYALAMVAALLAGQGTAASKTVSLQHLIGFPVVMAAVVTLVINLEHPRLGLISVDSFDQAMVEVRRSMD